MSTTIETPSTAPVAEPSLDDIIAQELSSAPGDVVKESGDHAQGASEADGAHTADPAGATPAPATEGDKPADAPAEETKPDDVTAARVRKMLAKLDEREAAIAAREAETGGNVLGELLKNPKAFLARHGKSIDDVIDASLAEGKAPEAPAADDRLTALERRIQEREEAEIAHRQQTAIEGRKAEIHREVAASAKFPLINEAKRQQDVTDFMIEYHSIHGKSISWDKAAAAVESDLTGLGIAAAKKLGWTAPAKAAPAAAPKDRPGTVSLSGDQRTAAPAQGDEPEDPEQLMKFLVKQSGLG